MADLNATNRHSIPFRNGPFGEIRDANTYWEWDDDEVKPDGIGILGSGSDSTKFLDHFGIPSLDFSFSKKTTYGQYHSIFYDSFVWMDRYGGYDDKVGSSFDKSPSLQKSGDSWHSNSPLPRSCHWITLHKEWP